MARALRRRSLDEKLAALRQAKEDPESPSGRRELGLALEDRNWLVVSEAASFIGEHKLHGHNESLLGIQARFAQDGAKVDPGCRAKEAALTALDLLELLDPSPFLAAIRYRQLEPVLGGRVDTAGSLRLRALFGLYRTFHPDRSLYAGELFADPNPHVRAGVARAIAEYADRPSGGLLVQKLCSGDDDPVVWSECAASLTVLADEFALTLFASMLERGPEGAREVAALALGQSKSPGGVAALLTWIEHANGPDFELGLRALGLSRLEPARAFLLEVVREGSPARARAAAAALAVHYYDRELWARVEQAAAANPDAGLAPVLEDITRHRR
jgi:HEAT repeat protein